MQHITEIAGERASRTDASLYLAVTDEADELFQGNLFASVQHEGSGTTWRTLHWHKATRSFLFSNLPIGRFTYRVWTSSERSIQGLVELKSGANHHKVKLPESAPRLRLEFCIQDRLADWRSRFSFCDFDPKGNSALQTLLDPDRAAGILFDLLCDRTVIASVVRPISELGISPDLWRFLDGYTQPNQGPSVLAARARYVTTTLWVALSPAIHRRVAKDATAAEIWAALLGVASTLDTPGLDDVFVWGAWVYRPQTALFEEFARAWAERFNGLNNLRGHTRAHKPIPEINSLNMPKLPNPPAGVSDTALRNISAAVLADIAHILCRICEDQ